MSVQTLKQATLNEREKLLNHSLYKHIESPQDLQVFMQHHVYAVWDFMSLLKSLQQQLTCVSLPWRPVGLPKHRYLINEIVLAEETDLNQNNERQSHFEMYIDAMLKAKANTTEVLDFIENIDQHNSIIEHIEVSPLPSTIKSFLKFTFKLISEGKSHKIAAAFTFGREELIPDMFTSIIEEIQNKFPEEDLRLFKYYFDRHIELDDDEHGPMALELITELCGDNQTKWRETEECAIEALKLRQILWDGIEKEILLKKAIA